MAELILPDFVVFVAIAGWIVTQVLTMWGARWVVKRAQHESVKQKNDVVDHFDEELKILKVEVEAMRSDLPSTSVEGFQAEVQGLRAHLEKLDGALGEHFGAIHEVVEKLPERIRMAAISGKGVEMKAMYRDAVEGEGELEEYVAEVADPASIAMAKIEAIQPSEKWESEHPLGKMIVEAGKELLRAKMDESRGVVQMKRAPGSRTNRSVYG